MSIKTKGTDDKIVYEVKEECGTIATLKNGNEIKLRYMSWNGREPKYDIRTWYKDENGEEKCQKGIGLTGEQLIELGKIIKELQKSK